MSLSDKEIALELTKAYIEHLNVRANSNNISESHMKAENVPKLFEYYYSIVSKCGNETPKE